MINLRGEIPRRFFHGKEYRMKNRCFAVRSGNRCAVLKVNKCEGVTCPFYKTALEAGKSAAHAHELLRRLSPCDQMDIADKYYSGRCRW